MTPIKNGINISGRKSVKYQGGIEGLGATGAGVGGGDDCVKPYVNLVILVYENDLL